MAACFGKLSGWFESHCRHLSFLLSFVTIGVVIVDSTRPPPPTHPVPSPPRSTAEMEIMLDHVMGALGLYADSAYVTWTSMCSPGMFAFVFCSRRRSGRCSRSSRGRWRSRRTRSSSTASSSSRCVHRFTHCSPLCLVLTPFKFHHPPGEQALKFFGWQHDHASPWSTRFSSNMCIQPLLSVFSVP